MQYEECIRIKNGFSLLELLVVISIISVIAALLLPAVASSRSAARKAQCTENLRNIGIGFQSFSGRDPSERFCTGNSDFRRDGCVDKVGWVADLVNAGLVVSSGLLDPANPMQGTEVVNDLWKFDSQDGISGVTETAMNAGVCGQKRWINISGGAG